MSVTRVRDRLCQLLRDRSGSKTIEITRRGRAVGLLLMGTRAASRAQASVGRPTPRRTLQGTVEIHGDLEAGLRKVRAKLWRSPRT
jgi:antitoxin (DNA-binding transcriptional repressor) of toxin-antitoxin stability system